ncbi:MAG TPA: hypothetical protein VLG47_05110 [Candidatus Saccharimonadales bacterium]|nr:hypothetical protein [Candidatus Saccharimonadales bacterium]
MNSDHARAQFKDFSGAVVSSSSLWSVLCETASRNMSSNGERSRQQALAADYIGFLLDLLSVADPDDIGVPIHVEGLLKVADSAIGDAADAAARESIQMQLASVYAEQRGPAH